jgi:hypothetical protein
MTTLLSTSKNQGESWEHSPFKPTGTFHDLRTIPAAPKTVKVP